MIAVGTDPIAALMESTNPSAGFSVTVSVILVLEVSLSSSVTVSVNVHCPGARLVSVYSGPLKSTSPVKSPSRLLSMRSLSQSYCNVSLSPSVSRELNPERVMLSPSVNSNTLLEFVIAAEGGRFCTLMFTEVIACAPSSSVTVAVIWRIPRVDHAVVNSIP